MAGGENLKRRTPQVVSVTVVVLKVTGDWTQRACLTAGLLDWPFSSRTSAPLMMIKPRVLQSHHHHPHHLQQLQQQPVLRRPSIRHRRAAGTPR